MLGASLTRGMDTKKPDRWLQPTILISALIFTIAMYALEEILFNNPQVNYLRAIFGTDAETAGLEKVLAIFSSVFSFFIAVLFFYGAFASPLWLRLVYAVIFAGLVTAEYSCYMALNRFANLTDVELGITSPPQLWLNAGKLYFNWVALVPIVMLLIAYWSTKPTAAKTGAASILIILILVLAQETVSVKANNRLNWGISPIQGVNVSVSYFYQRAIAEKRETLEYQSSSVPKNNIVLIIDESLRGDHLSINGYHRPTTPYLEQLSLQEDLFHNWGIAVPGATCSNAANGLLITGLQIKEGSLEAISSHPTLFQYAKAMNYQTVYIDAQTNHLWNGLNSTDLVYIDHRITTGMLGQKEYYADFAAAEYINGFITRSTGNFIVLNKTGTHFLYEDMYPRWAQVWKPVPENAADYENQPDLTSNSYDNAILFNVNGFFKELFPEPADFRERTMNTFYFYTSDHAESLFENGATSTHCGATRQETQVPLIIMGHLPESVDTTYRASHSNIFATILDLMGVPESARVHEYDLSLFDAKGEDSKDRLFFGGDGTIVNHDALE